MEYETLPLGWLMPVPAYWPATFTVIGPPAPAVSTIGAVGPSMREVAFVITTVEPVLVRTLGAKFVSPAYCAW